MTFATNRRKETAGFCGAKGGQRPQLSFIATSATSTRFRTADFLHVGFVRYAHAAFAMN
jgi:hypothetical protein